MTAPPREDIDDQGYFLEALAQGIRIHHTSTLPHFQAEAPVEIRPGVLAEHTLFLGAYSYISEGTRLWTPTTIGRYCSIAPNCDIGGVEHPTGWVTTHPFAWGRLPLDHWPAMRQARKSRHECLAPVAIGHDVWIGAGAFIRNGLSLGTGAIIGARAVVTRDVPPYAIVAGNPGRIIRHRFSPEIIRRLLASQWWRLDVTALDHFPLTDVERFLARIEERMADGLAVP